MHRPWEHAADIKNLFENRSFTDSFLEDRLEESLKQVSDLETIANKKRIRIYEPFQGTTAFGGIMHVLGPSQQFYEELLPHFREMPTPLGGLRVLAPIRTVVEQATKLIRDHLQIDLLNDEDDSTSPENNTSTLILFNICGQRLLFTGAAGKTALLHGVTYADSLGIPLTDLWFLDVPHHGSKRNLSSGVLKRIKGRTAFISASKDSPKHPAKKVTNALKKHEMAVYVTRGKGLRHSYQAPERVGWSAAQQEEFHDHVEE